MVGSAVAGQVRKVAVVVALFAALVLSSMVVSAQDAAAKPTVTSSDGYSGDGWAIGASVSVHRGAQHKAPHGAHHKSHHKSHKAKAAKARNHHH